MKPYPLVALNHFTVPIATSQFSSNKKKQLNERDSSVDLAANRRQKAVADWSRRRLSVISVNVLLPPQSFSMFCQPHPGPLPQSALLQQPVDCRLDDLP